MKRILLAIPALVFTCTTVVARSAQLPGETCATAIPISGDVVVSATNMGYASEGAAAANTNCGGITDTIDLWYEWTPDHVSNWRFTTCGTVDYSTQVALWSSCGGVLLDCNDFSGFACGIAPSHATFSVVGLDDTHPYYVQVGGGGASNTGTGTLRIQDLAPPLDADMDGFDSGVDCDDSDPNVNPGMTEVCCNGIDDDCNGVVDDPGLCLSAINYCVGAANSVSPTGAQMSAEGSGDVLLNCLVLTGGPIVPGEFGVFFHGAAQTMNPFGDGFQCAGGGIVRVWPPSPADGTGAVTRALDINGAGGVGIMAGVSRNFQLWYRDPTGGPDGFNLSDGLEVTFF